MNARESLAADRDADAAYRRASEMLEQPLIVPNDEMAVLLLASIAAELRAARVYANYLEGRNPAMRGGKYTP